jgi:hypothetical protein
MEDIEEQPENEEPELPTSYEELVTEQPERPIDLAEMPKSLSEMEEDTPNKTDLQAVLKTLTPVYKDAKLNDILQAYMVSRVFPDNMLDACKLTVLRRLQQCDSADPDVDVLGIILSVHSAFSIGYEGRGIVDRLEIAGVAHEQEMEKLSKELGL